MHNLEANFIEALIACFINHAFYVAEMRSVS